MFLLIQDSFQNKLNRYYLLCFFMSMHFFGAVLMPFFTEWGGVSTFTVFLLQSWFAFWTFALEIPTGVVADYFGRKYSIALAASVVIFGALLYGSIPRIEIFLLGEFLFALAVALQSGADEAFLYDFLKENNREDERSKIFGRAQSMNLLGSLIAAPLGGLIAYKLGLNYPMLLTAVPFSIGALIAWSLPEPKIHRQSETSRYSDILFKGWSFFINNQTLRKMSLDAVLVAIAGFYVFWMYQPLLQTIKVPLVQFGLFQMLILLAQIGVSSNFNRFEKLLGSPEAYLRFSALLTALAFFIVAIFPNYFTIILFVVIGGGFGATRLNFATAHMNAHIPSAERATILSFVNMLRRALNIVLNPLVGLMVDRNVGILLLLIGLLPLSMVFFSPVRKSMFLNAGKVS